MANSGRTEYVLPLVYGVVAHVTLHWGLQSGTHAAAAATPGQAAPLWYQLGYPLAWAICATAPGFLAGWFANRRVFVLGAAIGLVASLIEQPTIDMPGYAGGWFGWTLVLDMLAAALSPAILSAVACAAGRHARPVRPEPASPAPVPAKPRRR